MATYDLYGDTSGLPKTRRTQIPYEIEALTPREVWGAGSGSTTIVCRQDFNSTGDWIRDMVGQVYVTSGSFGGLALRRFIPEPLGYGFGDERVQFCTMVDQTEQGGLVNEIFASKLSGWPICRWSKFRTTFEAMPYAILDDGKSVYDLPSMADIVNGAGAYAGARELYRYVIRTRKTYSREQPIPGASTAGGFKIIVDPDTVPTGRKAIGQIGQMVVSMADVTYKWCRVPVGWPPPIGYVPPDPLRPWPPVFNPAATSPATNLRARDKFIGTINDDWFDVAAPDGYAHPPGTLLFTGYDDSNRYYDAAGDWVCDVVFNFKSKRAVDNTGSYGGFNWFLSALGQWKEVSLTGTLAGARPYKTNNFNQLFEYA